MEESFVKDPQYLPPLTLAYIGDSVFEMIVRRKNLISGFKKVDRLHRETVKRVNASAQARLLELIEIELSPEERAILRRGRNTYSGHTPKNSTLLDYRKSTGLEALIGYLYLAQRLDRVEEIIDKIDFALERGEKIDA
jgi:ribonuclease-3 family protein